MGLAPGFAGPLGDGGAFLGGHLGAADAVVGEAEGGHSRRVVEVAAVEDHRLAEQAGHHLEVGVAELVPLGGDRQGVGLLEGAVGAVAVGQLVAVDLSDVGQGLGIVDPD